MKAATAYNVIQALSKDELPKLYKMLGVQQPKQKRTSKKNKLVTLAQATDDILAMYITK
ncbi:hypothetical protein H2O64_04850 [Kordia sp. YSTF-M3]|uniref:Uncharacterized protein n=1 Tax=Kordia aestuariivivens TaxID=2759037 RepID=A0ABR7Q664_9FLAO|nr:hypothetical protein [Kordia aestuariivivens]MBC8753988.1 hypothetical protein [Kordia aestuariivivens]